MAQTKDWVPHDDDIRSLPRWGSVGLAARCAGLAFKAIESRLREITPALLPSDFTNAIFCAARSALEGAPNGGLSVAAERADRNCKLKKDSKDSALTLAVQYASQSALYAVSSAFDNAPDDCAFEAFDHARMAAKRMNDASAIDSIEKAREMITRDHHENPNWPPNKTFGPKYFESAAAE
jgi:hypothetical protein